MLNENVKIINIIQLYLIWKFKFAAAALALVLQVNWLIETLITLQAAFPIETTVALSKPLPWIVTTVPP